MVITMDQEDFESEALLRLSGGFAGASVLEIGCGDGRLTWLIASQARRVVGIDPKEERIARARKDTPSNLESRVLFTAQSLEEYAASIPSSERFDRALLSWSL